MRIFVTGTRGIPHIPGGVEKHCEELFPRITAKGHHVFLCTRKSYVKNRIDEWRKIKLIQCFAPRKKSLEAIVHTIIALLKARGLGPDIVHIHAIGPSLLAPFARLMGFKVVVTNHGPDYDRDKWGKAAKIMLRLGEYLGCHFANEVIVVSHVIGNIVKERCKRESNVIYNGVSLPKQSVKKDYLERIGTRPGNYILAVSRFVPEKGLDILIQAFQRLDPDLQLVLVGDADHETDYSWRIKQMIKEDKRVIHTGYITGESLNQVYSHARLFVLPSFHEGLPIALLEAMSYGLPVLVSDIPANLEVALNPERYFRCGDINDLVKKMDYLLNKVWSANEKEGFLRQIEEKYNWDKIADQTIAVYEKVLAG